MISLTSKYAIHVHLGALGASESGVLKSEEREFRNGRHLLGDTPSDQ
jgi:hypothetical protein